MTEIQQQEEFEHFHRSALKNLEIDKGLLVQKQPTGSMRILDAELLETLERICADLRFDDQLKPDSVFRSALGAMDAIDAKRFLLDNILESLKAGKHLPGILQNYQKLGLLRPPPQGTVREGEEELDKPAKEILERKGLMKQFALAVAQIAVNAFKSIPKMVEIEPMITFIGPVPALSFALKGKGITIHQLFETLRASGRFYSPSVAS